jgi:hypothetical protein
LGVAAHLRKGKVLYLQTCKHLPIPAAFLQAHAASCCIPASICKHLPPPAAFLQASCKHLTRPAAFLQAHFMLLPAASLQASCKQFSLTSVNL